MLIFSREEKDPIEETIDITTTIESDGQYYISYLGGSTEYGEILKIQIDSDHQFEEESIYTQTKDKSSIILKDIYRTFVLKKGTVQIKIIKPKNTAIYEIHINVYDKTKEITGIYEELQSIKSSPMEELPSIKLSPIEELPPIKSEDKENTRQPLNKYLIIRNVTASYGGFWWCVNLALHGCIIAETYNLIPVIDYKGGLYSSNKIYEPEQIRNLDSWWNYFFEDPVPISEEARKHVLDNKKLYPLINLPRNKARLTRRQQPYIFPEIPQDTSFEYTVQSFNHCYKLFKTYDRYYINKYLILKPYITNYLDKWALNNISSNKKVVGIHYRGTDKFGWGTCNEGNPIHYNYEKVIKAIKTKMNELNEQNYIIYCASDELPFIEFIKTQFPNRIIAHEDMYDIRSKSSTSGLNHDFSKIIFNDQLQTYVKNNNDENEEEKEKQMNAWKEIKNISIHFGKKESSNYMKGFYTIIDTKLFSNCDYIFRSRGNMSDYVCRLNNKAVAIYDLNELAN
jgi:hypothetical protein